MKTTVHDRFSATDFLRQLPEAFTKLNRDQRELSLSLYRYLAKGLPVGVDDLVATTSLEEVRVKEILNDWPGIYYNDDHKITGYWGLAIIEMGHKIEFENKTLFGWCAWDTLFLPQLLGKDAVIRSSDQSTNEEVVIEVDGNGNLASDGTDIYVSLLEVDEESIKEEVISSFCHFIYFFKSRSSGETWVSQHNGTFLITLEEALELSQTKNRLQYDDFLFG